MSYANSQKLITKAHQALSNGDLERALLLYKEAASRYGSKSFDFNIKRIEKVLSRDRQSEKNAIVFTNLCISQIDGSVVFIANAIRILSLIFNRVFLVSVHKPGENFLGRCDAIDNLEIIVCNSEHVCQTLSRLSRERYIALILARTWGDVDDWIDDSFAHKTIYYWPLLKNYSESHIRLHNKVSGIAVQTLELQNKIERILGKKDSIIFPPLVERRILTESNNSPDPLLIHISYTGTIRPECYGIEMIECFKHLLEKYKYLKLTLAIGKIYYVNLLQRQKVDLLISELKNYRSVSILRSASHEVCQSILAKTDISLSLWEPNDQNNTQISTKFLECIANGCITICFKSSIYETILGSDYEYFIGHISEVERIIEKAILNSFNKKIQRPKSFPFQDALLHYSMESHIYRISQWLGYLTKKSRSYLANSFSSDFDCIYGLYINDDERRSLIRLSERLMIPIRLFEGVNGKQKLNTEYELYCKSPIGTEWEICNNKKRLTIGAMGHLHSFVNIAKDAIVNNYSKILVLESDVIPHVELLKLYFRNRITNYKILYLGAGMWNSDIEMKNGYYLPNDTTGTFAIAFDSTVLPECIEQWSQMINPTDIVLVDICDKYYGECFVCYPNLFICDLSSSSITTPRSQKGLSAKFQWNLDDYEVFFVKYIERFVRKLRIVVNHCMQSPSLRIYFENGDYLDCPSEGGDALLLNSHVNRIEYANMFITDFICE